MAQYRLLNSAYQQLDAIYEYTYSNWGLEQAEKYISQLFDCFESISKGHSIGQAIPLEFEVSGNMIQCQKHVIYWEKRATDQITIVAILHQRMHQIERLQTIIKLD